MCHAIDMFKSGFTAFSKEDINVLKWFTKKQGAPQEWRYQLFKRYAREQSKPLTIKYKKK